MALIDGWLAFINQFSTFLFLIGLAGVAAWNLWKWIGDRKLARMLANQPVGPARLTATPRVSILVAAWNEAIIIEDHLQSIQALSYPNLEYILCAGGTDGTFEIARRCSRETIRVIEQKPGEGKQKALQRCLERATGEIVYLIDADCLITDSVFAWTMAPIINLGEQAVSGSLYTPLPGQLSNPFVLNQCATRAYSAAHQPPYITGLLGGNCAIRREPLEQAGAFKNEVKTGTDYDLAKRLIQVGVRIKYEAEAYIQAQYPSRINDYFRQQARWVRNVTLHGLHFHAYGEVSECLRTSLVGCGMLLAPCLALPLAFGSGWFFQIGMALIAMWILAVIHALFSRLRYLGFIHAWLGFRLPTRHFPYMLFFLWIDFIAWAIPLGEYAFRPLRERW